MKETPATEKRGPIEKGPKGWPVNPIGVVALLVFGLIIILLIIRPLFQKKTTIIQQDKQENAAGGSITIPSAGEVVKGKSLIIELSVDKPQDVEKVQFWIKTYVDGKWQMIGEVNSTPYKFDWNVPDSLRNKSIA